MTPEKQRIAIAGACPEIMKGGYVEFGMPMRHLRGDRFTPFDPLKDLNAMQEAIKTLTDVEKIDFVGNLYLLTRGNHSDMDVALILATASQLAVAFLQTKDKWEYQ